MEDERAQAVASALGAKDWGLDRVEKVLAGSAAADGEETALRQLREAAAPPTPSAKRWPRPRPTCERPRRGRDKNLLFGALPTRPAANPRTGPSRGPEGAADSRSDERAQGWPRKYFEE